MKPHDAIDIQVVEQVTIYKIHVKVTFTLFINNNLISL